MLVFSSYAESDENQFITLYVTYIFFSLLLLCVAVESLFKKISDYIEFEIGYKDVLCCYLYCWKQTSFIPWHTDAEHNAALTIYLNNFWDRDWGGYFMYYDNDDIKCIIPKENLAILQENNPLHSTTMTTPSSSDRITLQLFLNNKIENLKKSNTLI